MQLNNPTPNVTRAEPFSIKAALVLSLNDKKIKQESETHKN